LSRKRSTECVFDNLWRITDCTMLKQLGDLCGGSQIAQRLGTAYCHAHCQQLEIANAPYLYRVGQSRSLGMLVYDCVHKNFLAQNAVQKYSLAGCTETKGPAIVLLIHVMAYTHVYTHTDAHIHAKVIMYTCPCRLRDTRGS
jgi:hypothetical protein